MKKFSFVIVALAAMVLASCGGQTTKVEEETPADSSVSFEQAQIKESIKMHIDSIAKEMSVKSFNNVFDNSKNGKIALTDEEKKVKPDFLLQPEATKELATYAQKYAALAMLKIDSEVAKLYDVDVTEYNNAIAKLLSEINDPAFSELNDAEGDLATKYQTLYEGMEKEGRINFYWIASSALVVENLYIMSQNADKFVNGFTDEQVSDITFRLVCIFDALDRLSVYDPQIPGIAEALEPLKVLNAETVDEFKAQLAKASADIAAAREALLK